ncbi:MAG: hypothetical protein AAFR39_13535 [Pseudomonadota bacterium]
MPSENMPTCTGETHNNTTPKTSLALAFDWQEWLPYFEDQDIPEAQKREMIETLWQIVVAFVDLGFDLNPHQQAQNQSSNDAQESAGETFDLKAVLEQLVLVSEAAEAAQISSHRNQTPKPK